MIGRLSITILAAAAISTTVVVAPGGTIAGIGAGQRELRDLLRHDRHTAPGAVYEAVPAPRPGYVWAPGHWGWERAANAACRAQRHHLGYPAATQDRGGASGEELDAV